MKTKSLLAFLLAGLMSVGVLGSCGNGSSSSTASDASTAGTDSGKSTAGTDNKTSGTTTGGKKKYTISICGATLEDGINATTKRTAQGYNTFAANQMKEAFPDVEIVFNSIPWDNASGKMQTILMSNGTDLFTQGGAFIPEYYKEGLMQSLTPFVDSDTSFVYEDEFPANFKTHPNCTDYSGKELLTLPWQIGYRIIIYDKQLFDDWGVEYLSENPTPEEVLEKAAKMTGKNPKTGAANYGLYMPANTLNMSYLIPLTEYFGATECTGQFDQPGNLKWSMDTPEFVKSVQWVVDGMKLVPQAASTGQGTENWGKATNDIAINIDTNGVGIMNEIRNTGDESLLDRFEPTMHFGKDGGNWTPVDGMGMASYIKDDDAKTAWEILKFMTGKDFSTWYYENYGPCPIANLVSTTLYDAKDKYLAMNSKVMAHATHPGYEINPFYGSTMQPTFASMFSRSIAGETIDVQKELGDLQKKAVEWSASKK